MMLSRRPCGSLQHIGSLNRSTAHVQPRRPQRQRLHVSAIGFDFGDAEHEGKSSTPIPTKLSTLCSLSGSLLVFGPVLRGSVGEAFLATLNVVSKYQASNKDVLSAFTKFYSLLLQAGHSSWEEHLIEQIFLGRDNAFARAVAQGNVGAGAPILKAVAYDLDVLQRLSVPMPRLAECIGDAAPIAGPYWIAAASSVATKPDVQQLAGNTPPAAVNMNMPSTYIQRPATPDELRAWGWSLSNKQEWSEATGTLMQYYHLHGFGITSRNSALRWSKGAFEEGFEGESSLGALSVLQKQRQLLARNTADFCDGLPAHHCLVAGPSGSGKSWLLWESTLMAGKDKGMRIVDVPSGEQGALLEVARGAGRYPRIRFILVVDSVDLPLPRGSGLANDLMSGLTCGSGPSGWPSNVLLYVGASPSSTISFTDHVVSRFGLVLTTDFLSEIEFFETLNELAQQAVPEDQKAPAVAWANCRGGLTIRNASQYLKFAFVS